MCYARSEGELMADIIQDDFLDEEYRCDYFVSKKVKRVWAVELDLYNVFESVCKKNNLTYYWAYGNLLGAVRHKGFIPWDDDIDVFLFREDYEKLCSIGKDMFTYPYFFQNEHTDPGSHIAFSKLRNCETSAILDFEKPYNYLFNQGIFLDIFPLDKVPDNQEDLKILEQKIRKYKYSTVRWARIFDSRKFYFGRKWVYLLTPFLFIARIIVHTFRIPNIPCIRFEKLMQRYNSVETRYVSMMALGELIPIPLECFRSTIELPFEFLKVPAPSGYEKLLECWYGNWHQFIKGTEGGSMHEGIQYDTERSYKEYIKR